MPAILIVGLFLIAGVSITKAARVARTVGAPRVRLGAVVIWMVGTFFVAVVPAIFALGVLDGAGDFVRFDGAGDLIGVAVLWVGLCDVADVGRLVSARRAGPGGAGSDAAGGPTAATFGLGGSADSGPRGRGAAESDRRLLLLGAVLATAAYAAALLITVGFVDDAHVSIVVAVVLGAIAAAATAHGGPKQRVGGKLLRGTRADDARREDEARRKDEAGREDDHGREDEARGDARPDGGASHEGDARQGDDGDAGDRRDPRGDDDRLPPRV